MTDKTVLVVDDEAGIRRLVCGILEDEGYATCEASSADEAFVKIAKGSVDAVILDIWLEGSRADGLDILREIKITNALLPVIMMSGHGTIETAVNAIKDGAYDFLEKPFKSGRLIVMVARAIEAATLEKENRQLKDAQSAKALSTSSMHKAVACYNDLVSAPPVSTNTLMHMPLKEARHCFEHEYLTAQLERFGGNVSKTAVFVGMERSALHRKLKTLEESTVTSDNAGNVKQAAQG